MSLCFEWYTLEVDDVIAVADELRTLCVEDGIPMWHAVGTVYRGAAAAARGDAPLANTLMSEGFQQFEQIGSRLTLLAMNALAAHARILLGELDEAWRHLDQAQVEADTRNEHMWEPEIDRLRARIQLRRGDVKGAETSLRQALAKARAQKASMLELRAALDLHDLLAAGGRRGEGVALVDEAARTIDPESKEPEVARMRALALVTT
jgi:hypothetical protein